MNFFFHSKKLSSSPTHDQLNNSTHCIGDGMVYSYGGEMGMNMGKNQAIHTFDLSTKTKQQRIVSDGNKTEAPPTQQGHAMIYLPEMKSLYIFGGEVVRKRKNKVRKQVLGHLYMYDLERNIWKRLRDCPRPMSNHSMIIRRDMYGQGDISLIAFGGQTKNNKCHNELFRYSIVKNRWDRIQPMYTEDAQPMPRSHHSMTFTPNTDTLFIYGGQCDGQYKNDLWKWNFMEESWEEIYCENSPPPRPATAVLLGHSHVIVYEFDEQSSQYLYLLDLRTRIWKKELMEGYPVSKGFYTIRRAPRLPMLLLVGEELYGIEWLQKLPTIEEISGELQTNMTTKDTIIHFEKRKPKKTKNFEIFQNFRTVKSSQKMESDSTLLAHKLILIQSPVLKDMLEKNIQPAFQKMITIVVDAEKPAFEVMTQFLYGSHPNLTTENVIEVMAVAKQFKIDGLFDLCLQTVHKLLNVSNSIDLMKRAHHYGLTIVNSLLIGFVMDHHYLEMLELDEFGQVPSPILHQLMKIREGLIEIPELPLNLNSVTNPQHILMKHFNHIKKFGICHDFVIRSNDGRSFRCHRAILTLRSPYFVNIVKNAKAGKHIFNEVNSNLSISGKLLSLIMDDIYGTFVAIQGTKLSKSLSVNEMKEVIEYSKLMSLYSLINNMISQLSMHITEENAIELLEFAVRLETDLKGTPLENNRTLRQVCMSMIRKPESDLEYSMMMSKFFEAKHQGEQQPEKHFSPVNKQQLVSDLTSQLSESLRLTSQFEEELKETHSPQHLERPITPISLESERSHAQQNQDPMRMMSSHHDLSELKTADLRTADLLTGDLQTADLQTADLQTADLQIDEDQKEFVAPPSESSQQQLQQQQQQHALDAHHLSSEDTEEDDDEDQFLYRANPTFSSRPNPRHDFNL